MGGTLFEKLAAGAFLGAVVTMSRQLMKSAAADFSDIDTDTTAVSEDPQFVDVLMFLRVDGVSEYTKLVTLANQMVKLYKEHLQEVSVGQAQLASQMSMQELYNHVMPYTQTYHKAVEKVEPSEVDTLEEHLITYEAICKAYLDNMYLDSMNVIGGDSTKFDMIQTRLETMG